MGHQIMSKRMGSSFCLAVRFDIPSFLSLLFMSSHPMYMWPVLALLSYYQLTNYVRTTLQSCILHTDFHAKMDASCSYEFYFKNVNVDPKQKLSLSSCIVDIVIHSPPFCLSNHTMGVDPRWYVVGNGNFQFKCID